MPSPRLSFRVRVIRVRAVRGGVYPTGRRVTPGGAVLIMSRPWSSLRTAVFAPHWSQNATCGGNAGRASIAPQHGLQHVHDRPLGAVRREDGVVEHYHAQQNRPLLERLAAATGGSYFPVADMRRLPEAVSFSDAGSVERQVLDLWNMPIVFLLLLALKAGEWLLRLVWGRL